MPKITANIIPSVLKKLNSTPSNKMSDEVPLCVKNQKCSGPHHAFNQNCHSQKVVPWLGRDEYTRSKQIQNQNLN